MLKEEERHLTTTTTRTKLKLEKKNAVLFALVESNLLLYLFFSMKSIERKNENKNLEFISTRFIDRGSVASHNSFLHICICVCVCVCVCAFLGLIFARLCNITSSQKVTFYTLWLWNKCVIIVSAFVIFWLCDEVVSSSSTTFSLFTWQTTKAPNDERSSTRFSFWLLIMYRLKWEFEFY
jgi:hypothetical protein